MFIKAIESIAQFTRPIHTITRTYGGATEGFASTLFFVNDDGVAITCKHVAELLIHSDALEKKYSNFKTERALLPAGKKYNSQLRALEAKYGFKKDDVVILHNTFMNCGKFTSIKAHIHPQLDLAIIVLEGFENKAYTSHATFINDPLKVKQGKFLCRYGYPFPEFTNYRYDEQADDLVWTEDGNTIVSFPLDGMITRFIVSPSGVTGIELSTPGLKGQSGGPLFDEDGLIYGMQFATGHMHLGFDIKDLEILSGGKKRKVSDVPFLHVGQCVHVDRIKEFLRDKQITFFE